MAGIVPTAPAVFECGARRSLACRVELGSRRGLAPLRRIFRLPFRSLLDALFDQIHIVLLRPRWANNLGSVARAMKNFGLRRLTLVDSRIGSWTDAWKMAVHSKDVLENCKQAATLGEVVAPSTWIVGTTNEPLQGQRVMSPRELATEAATRSDTTLLFGGEINGLEPAELLRCHAVAVIPTAPEQSSLNLAQAVAVFAAELFAVRRSASPPPPPPSSAALATA